MRKNYFLIILLAILIAFSCKKDSEPAETPPVDPGSMSLIFVKTDVSCPYGSDGGVDITVAGGYTPYAYAWSNGSTTEDIYGLAAGSYIVNVLDSHGNLLIDTFNILQPSPIVITEEYYPELLDITVVGGTGPYSYLWSTGDTTEDLADYDYSPCSLTVTDSNNCSAFKEFTPPVIEDGMYVVGDACGNPGIQTTAMMYLAKNEVIQEIREGMYEHYIPLKSGTSGFNIVRVQNSLQTYFGPDDAWGIVTNPTTDEPKDVPIQRGPVQESMLKFNVEEDGLYHVVIDMELMVAVVCQVHWGVIGQCTPSGWFESTDFNESAFDPVYMSWEINDLTMLSGDFRFRYSNGWKIELDTVGVEDVKVNTNFGGALDALVPGGDNFINNDGGLYTITMDYTLGSGYMASMFKTGDLPFTDWSSVVCDAVGDGISADNPNAIVPDPSGWAWGNKIIADNGGIPEVNGDVYTWTWTSVILEADAGFKVRTENGEAPPSGGANFDAGYGNLNVDASSTHVVDAGGNLSVDLKGAYTITIVIDAASDDEKVITIIED